MVSETKPAMPQSEQEIETLLEQLTLAEKVSLLSGSDLWFTTPVERVGIPKIKVSDGPNGARGESSVAGGKVTAACFPAAISLAASWDTDLVAEVGKAIGEEAKTKGAALLLGPTMNIHRSPLNGRNFECYSEDPYLSSRMAVAYITGLQSQQVGATPKHFVCNDSEFERNSISSDVDERTLREIYLPPFYASVTEAKSWAILAGYNRLNGTFVGEHRWLLIDLLKGEWGFDGLVMSDWFGTQSTEDAVINGLDLEMPGPPHWRGEKLLAAVEAGKVSTEAIDEATRRIVRTLARVGAFEHPVPKADEAIDRPEHRALIRKAAAGGSVLLKNADNVLPIDIDMVKKIAIIGPNAKVARISGGGSAQLNPHYRVTPYDGIAAAVGDRIELGYELGCRNYRALPHIDPSLVAPRGHEAEGGFTVSYFNSLDLSGDLVFEEVSPSSEQWWNPGFAPGVNEQAYSARIATTFTPAESGAYQFSLVNGGKARLLLNGRLVLDNWTAPTPGEYYFGMGSTEVRAAVDLTAGQAYDLAVEYTSEGAWGIKAVRLGMVPPDPADAIERAAALAAASDVAIIFAGLNGGWDTEGYDRTDIVLPGGQDALIERVAAANPKTVVVLQSGCPVAMPWLDKVAAVLQVWYPGQECGNAIADVLFGAVNPSGKLPQTFPVRLEDNPAYINYPGENGHVRYGEGLFVGYRYYEKKNVAPLFPFGYGLSYTTFAYSSLRLSASQIGPDDTLTVEIDVTNTGQRAGQEVVQLYVRDVTSRLMRPEKELKAFAKVALAPGETATATLTLDRTSLAYWDDKEQAWVAEAGDFEVLVGSSSADIHERAGFRLTETSLTPNPSPSQGRGVGGEGCGGER